MKSIYPGKWKWSQWSQLSAEQVFGKIRVPAKSRNRWELRLFRFHYSEKVHGVYTFIRFQAWYVHFPPKASISFKLQCNFSILYQRPLVIERGLNIRLSNKTSFMSVYTHYLCHALLFQCIFAGEYKRHSSFLTIRNLRWLILPNQLRIKSLNYIWVSFTVLFTPVIMLLLTL